MRESLLVVLGEESEWLCGAACGIRPVGDRRKGPAAAAAGAGAFSARPWSSASGLVHISRRASPSGPRAPLRHWRAGALRHPGHRPAERFRGQSDRYSDSGRRLQPPPERWDTVLPAVAQSVGALIASRALAAALDGGGRPARSPRASLKIGLHREPLPRAEELPTDVAEAIEAAA
jgi:hypothetical protein